MGVRLGATRHTNVSAKGRGRHAVKDAAVRTTRMQTVVQQQLFKTNGTEDASIEEVITDALPEDLDKIMEWVFGEYEAEAGCEEGSDNA